MGQSQALVQVTGTWYTAGVTVPPDALPEGLLDLAAAEGGAQQRAEIGGESYFVVAVQLTDAMYVEVFSLQDLDQTMTIGAWVLAAQTVAAGLIGVLIGRYTVGRLLRPLRMFSHARTPHRALAGRSRGRFPSKKAIIHQRDAALPHRPRGRRPRRLVLARAARG